MGCRSLGLGVGVREPFFVYIWTRGLVCECFESDRYLIVPNHDDALLPHYDLMSCEQCEHLPVEEALLIIQTIYP